MTVEIPPLTVVVATSVIVEGPVTIFPPKGVTAVTNDGPVVLPTLFEDEMIGLGGTLTSGIFCVGRAIFREETCETSVETVFGCGVDGIG